MKNPRSTSFLSTTSCASALTARLHLRSYVRGRVGGAKKSRRTYSSQTASPKNAYAMGDQRFGDSRCIVDGGILGIPSSRSRSNGAGEGAGTSGDGLGLVRDVVQGRWVDEWILARDAFDAGGRDGRRVDASRTF